MDLYLKSKFYSSFSHFISLGNIACQISLISIAITVPSTFYIHVIIFLFAYFLADFINGLVHLYMDNNDNYNLPFGPLVANFHLHHLRPRYTKKNIFIIYYSETGSKIWLLLFQILFLGFYYFNFFSIWFYVFVCYFSILSSLAEVSHYLCHTISSSWVTQLGNWRILLSRKHHSYHHRLDNMNYAFLNGLSDPLINIVAKSFYKGYKTTTDLHFKNFDISKIENRE